MNVILEKIIENRRGHYCHALEVESVYELETIIEQLSDEFINDGYSIEEIKEFFNTISVYSLNDENEDEIFAFNISDFIDGLIL